MKIKRMMCILICITLIFIMNGCAEAQVSPEITSETPQIQETEQGSSQNGVHTQPPLVKYFNSIDEIMQFFEINENGLDGKEVETIRNWYYIGDEERRTILEEVKDLYIPIAKAGDQACRGDWAYGMNHLDFCYGIDDIQYRFFYYFSDQYPGDLEDIVAEDVQAGPYTIDFIEAKPAIVHDTAFVGRLQLSSEVYMIIRVSGNGVEKPSFEDFDFIPLSSADNVVE